jgi:hypothetical protein
MPASRELARKVDIFLHIGTLAIKLSPEKAANRRSIVPKSPPRARKFACFHRLVLMAKPKQRP